MVAACSAPSVQKQSWTPDSSRWALTLVQCRLLNYQVPVLLLMHCKPVQELVREARSMQVGCPPWGLLPTQDKARWYVCAASGECLPAVVPARHSLRKLWWSKCPDKVVLTLLSAPGQIDATKLLALLLEAPDARQAAAEHVGSLTEQFFAIASTYLTMVLARPCLALLLTHGLSQPLAPFC